MSNSHVTTKTAAEVIASKEAFITVYLPIAGWKAVMYTWEEELGCHTPWETGLFGHATKAEAIEEALFWAESEAVAYVPSSKEA